ncbi:MAG TPA: aldehyde dehydrogenase family protein [Gemmatimonadota bacterium]|nr:aldehyde dehydrogenase family protein [Gemmatimonadota bacterium]
MTDRFDNWIGGEWVGSADVDPIVDPFLGGVVGEMALASAEDLERAIGAAEDAFMVTRCQSAWEREGMLRRTAEGIAARRKELVERMVAESGKPRRFADGEVTRAISTFTLAAEEAKRFGGEVVPVDIAEASEGYFALTKRFPRGAVAGIAPFNFPLNLIAHKVAPALATGSTIVVKPPMQAPLTSLLLAEILDGAGVPHGAVNFLHMVPEVAERLATDDRFTLLSFTGSAKVGWMLKAKSGIKPVLLELGGNAGMIVHEDADLAWARERAAVGAFAHAGQVCIKVQRLLVHTAIADDWIPSFVDRVDDLRMGDPRDPDTVVGPLIDDAQADRVEEWIQEALDHGAELLTGGRREGRFIRPAVLTNVGRDLKVWREEVFGPVVVVERYRDFEEAVSRIDDSRYGIHAGVFTHDIRRIDHAFRNLRVGGLIVNDYPTFRVDNLPYGGVKHSGLGREGVRYAMEAMTEPRILVFDLNH